MNNPRIVLTALLVCIITSTVSAQKGENETEQQILLQPTERVTSDSIVGTAIAVNNASVLVNFVPTPLSAYCGVHCASRSILRVQLAVSGSAGQYIGGRQVFSCPISVEVTGVTGTLQKWMLSGNPYSLTSSNTTTTLTPEQDFVVDVSSHNPARCLGSDSVSTSIKVRVYFIDTTGVPIAILDSLVLRATLTEEFKDNPFPSGTYTCSGTPMIRTDSAYITNPVTLKWSVDSCPDQFPLYEVNVLRLKNKSAAYRDNPNKLKDTVHWEKAQRLFAYGYTDRMTLTLAEGTGYYVWRVRPIGNYYAGGMANDSNWGCWSTSANENDIIDFSGTDSVANVSGWRSGATGRGVSMFYYKQFDADKNWQFGRVFVEGKDGRSGIAENMTYATSLLLPVQKQSPVPSTGRTLIQQTIPDYYGRPVMSTLGATRNDSIKAYPRLEYATAFAKKDTLLYRASHFDVSSKVLAPDTMTGRVGTYWSTANSDMTIPVAKGYPFMRTLYGSDPLGRVTIQSAAGSYHRIGTANTVRTLYGPTTERELVTMFGSEAPTDSSVSRIFTTDQNGVTSLTYQRMDGKTIATCLIKGDGNSLLFPLNDSSVINTVSLSDTVRRGTNTEQQRIVAQRTILITDTTSVTFNYFIESNQLQLECSSYCKTCDYNVYIKVTNVDSTTPTYYDSVLVNAGNCTSSVTGTKGPTSKTLLPGTYIMERTLQPRTSTPWLSLHTSQIVSEHKSKVQKLLKNMFSVGADSVDLDSFRLGKHYTNELIARRMLTQYKKYRRDSAASNGYMATVDTCCQVYLDSALCKTGCETDSAERPRYEQMLIDRWKDSVSAHDSLSGSGLYLDAYIYDYNGMTLLDSLGGSFPHGSGVIDSLIRTMIDSGGYDCAKIYDCWSSLVDGYWYMAWESDSNGARRKPGVNILDMFLDCVGTKYCSTAPRSERVTGAAWLLNAWKVLPSATLDSITAECTEMLNVDSTWTCNGSNDVEIDIKYQQLRACQSGSTMRYTYPNYSKDIYNKAKADSTNPYFVTLPEGVSKDTVNKIYRKMITECQSLCEQRRNRVRDSLVYMYVKNGSRVEGYYQLGPDSAIVDTIKTYQLACIVDLIVADCMDSCYFNIEWGLDTNGQDSLIHPTADELKRYNNTFMANSFRVKPAATGEVPCSGVGWHHINRKVVLADYLAEILNQKLKTHRDSMPAGVERWNILPILEELAAEYPPLAVCYPPTDTVSNPADSANANVQAFSVWTVMVDKSKESRFIVRLDSGVCSLEYEPPAVEHVPDPYSPEHPHPLVGMLNRYLRHTWGMRIPLADTSRYKIYSDYTTEFVNSTDYFTFYSASPKPAGLWADSNDHYRPSFATCDSNGIGNAENSWEFCPQPIACINGRDMTLDELAPLLKIKSAVRSIFKLHPSDDTVSLFGWLRFESCGQYLQLLFSTPSAVDTTLSFYWDSDNGIKFPMDSAQTEFNKFLTGEVFYDSVGHFVQTPDGHLGFVNYLDSNRTFTFDCIKFDCQPTISDSCNKIPMCNICDTVDCGSICFKWVDADTIAPTTSMKPKSCVVSEIDRLYHAIEGTLLNDCLARKIKNVEISYNATCFDPNRIKDRFTATRGESYYHYTLYYYDRSGNLVKTVPPSGFRPLTSGQTRSTTPSHVMVTKYDYNTLGQLVKQSTPDGGQTEFYYDGKGRLRLSHNARQASTTFSYTDYDALGRIIEVGEATGVSSPDTHAKTVASTSGGTFRVITTYTTAASSIPSPWAARTQRYLRNRVSYVKSDEDGDLGTLGDQVITYYSYDPHGNVEWLVQSIPGLYGGGGSQEGIAIDYDYDLMSGKVRKVVMQKGRYDQSMHRYEYDYDGRLTKVETSRDGWIWDRDAAYAYYPHGPLKRMELGHDLIQGVDYAYTINGWLKGMNTPKLDVAYDMGGDGYSSSANKRYGRDAFGMFLRYHDQDFKHTGSVLDQSGAISSWHQSGGDLFNGNISAWSINTRKPSGNGDSAIGSRYHYDVLNRLRTDSTQERYAGTWDTPSMKFGSTYTYDGNGNIKTLSRNETSGTFDNLEYRYITGTNKLSYIHENIVWEPVAGDLMSNDTNNYVYDATGNLTQDTSEHIGANGIVWTPMNKIRSITKSGSAQKIEYLYDAMGNRVRKQVYEPSTTLKSTTWYVRDPKGTVMATYMKTGSDTLRLTEIPIYGSERIGMMTPNVAYKSAGIDTMDATFTRELGRRLYELKDHLGNVRATVSDLLVDHSGSKDAELIASTDYYPFGMIIPGRSYKASGSTAYRYGFNGKENDNEVKGEGDQQDYGFRIYDPRLAKFLSVDPLASGYPELTPYQFASNQPIWAIDLDGLERFVITFRSFIPAASLTNPNPFLGPASFAGDNRDNYMLYANAAYRTEQKVEINFDEGIVRALNNTASATHGWESDGKPVPPSNSGFAGSISYQGKDVANANGLMIEKVGMVSHDRESLSATITFNTDASNKLLYGAPAINADLTLTIAARKDGSFDYSLTGKKDGFPAYELWVKEINSNSPFLLFGSNPGTSGNGPEKLLPPEEDVVSKSGSCSPASKSEVVQPFENNKPGGN